jgi:hypothetical protein
VIDHRGDAGRRAPGRVDTDARGPRIDYAAQTIRAAVLAHGMAAAYRAAPPVGGRQFLHDHGNQPL